MGRAGRNRTSGVRCLRSDSTHVAVVVVVADDAAATDTFDDVNEMTADTIGMESS